MDAYVRKMYIFLVYVYVNSSRAPVVLSYSVRRTRGRPSPRSRRVTSAFNLHTGVRYTTPAASRPYGGNRATYCLGTMHKNCGVEDWRTAFTIAFTAFTIVARG